jgi:hypothetical protein
LKIRLFSIGELEKSGSLPKRLAQKKGPAEAGPFVGLVGGVNFISPRGHTASPRWQE